MRRKKEDEKGGKEVIERREGKNRKEGRKNRKVVMAIYNRNRRVKEL